MGAKQGRVALHQLTRWFFGPRRHGYGALAMIVLPLLPGFAHPVRAQSALTCPLVAADVQAEQPTSLPTASGQDQYTLEGRTSEQVIQQWATIQDPDPEACRLVKEVQRRLAGEGEFARRECPDVLSGLRTQAELARGEAEILCRGRN